MPVSIDIGSILFLPCLPVCPSVCLHNFNLASKMHILRRIFLKLNMHVACNEFYILSNFDMLPLGILVLIKFCNFNIGHNFFFRSTYKFIVGTYMYLEEPHIIVPWFPRSHVKVKGHFIENNSIVHNLTVTGPIILIFDMQVPYDNAYHLILYFEPCDLTLTFITLRSTTLLLSITFHPMHIPTFYLVCLCI